MGFLFQREYWTPLYTRIAWMLRFLAKVPIAGRVTELQHCPRVCCSPSLVGAAPRQGKGVQPGGDGVGAAATRWFYHPAIFEQSFFPTWGEILPLQNQVGLLACIAVPSGCPTSFINSSLYRLPSFVFCFLPSCLAYLQALPLNPTRFSIILTYFSPWSPKSMAKFLTLAAWTSFPLSGFLSVLTPCLPTSPLSTVHSFTLCCGDSLPFLFTFFIFFFLHSFCSSLLPYSSSFFSILAFEKPRFPLWHFHVSQSPHCSPSPSSSLIIPALSLIQTTLCLLPFLGSKCFGTGNMDHLCL